MKIEYIPNWDKEKLKCNNCGRVKSVKYKNKEKHYCNKCILIEINK